MCSLIYFINKKSYETFRYFIPLIPDSEIRDQTSLTRKTIKQNIQNIENIPFILKDVYPNDEIHVTIAGDAASITPVQEKGDNAIYTYMVLPVEKKYRTFPIHTELTTNGASNEIIVSKFYKICDIVKSLNFIVDFISTDGDIGFDNIHID